MQIMYGRGMVVDKVECSSSVEIEVACRILEAGGLVIVPTETVYGVACDPSVPNAVEKLIALKGRDKNKPFAWLVSDVKEVQAEVKKWSLGLDALTACYWPGSLTLVLETISGWKGYRIPEHFVALELVKKYGKPLVLTSANRSGEKEARSVVEAKRALNVSFSLEGGVLSKDSQPSTVVKVEDGEIFCLREGAIAFKEVQSVFYGEG